MEKFFTPFLRVEGGEVRRKDAVDLEMTANRSITVLLPIRLRPRHVTSDDTRLPQSDVS